MCTTARIKVKIPQIKVKIQFKVVWQFYKTLIH